MSSWVGCDSVNDPIKIGIGVFLLLGICFWGGALGGAVEGIGEG